MDLADESQRCALVTRAAAEPTAGTAPTTRRWVALEQPGPWPRDLRSHRDPHVAAFVARAMGAGLRPVLITRPGAAGTAARRLLYVDIAATGTTVTTATVAGTAELAGVELPGRDEPLPGAPAPEPALLVCTNGGRDRCCAIDGRPLAAAVAATGEFAVWECTHLGGHRFAPTALVLPTGYAYGRLDLPGALATLRAAAAGKVEVGGCRGYPAWSAPAQLAELAVRERTGITDAGALTCTESPGWVLVAAADGRRWGVRMRREELPHPRLASCDETPAPAVVPRVVLVRELR